MGLPGSMDIPGQSVPGGGNYSTPTVRGQDFSRASNILGQTIPMLNAPKPQTMDFQDYESAAWARLGDTGARIGAALSDFAGNMAKANDEGNLARADNMMAQSFADHTDRMLTQPPHKWRSTWDEKEVPRLMKHFEEMRTQLSPSGQAKLDNLLENKMTGYGIRINAGATKKQIADNDAELVAQQERYREQGDFGTAGQVSAIRLASGYINNGQHQQNLTQFDKDIQADGLKRRTAIDPRGTETYLNDVIENQGATTPDYNLIGPDGIVAARDEARRRRITNQRDFMDEITEKTLTDPTSLLPEQIQQMAEEEGLPQEWINSLLNNWQVTYAATDEGKALFLQQQNDLYMAIRQWKPEFDSEGEMTDESFQQYIGLDMAIRSSMPPGHVERFTGTLRRQSREGANNTKNLHATKNRDIEASMISRIQSLYDGGILGDVDTMMKADKTMTRGQAMREMEQTRLELRDAARDIVENNPAIQHGEALRQFDEMLRDRFRDNPKVMELFERPAEGGLPQWLRNLFSGNTGDNLIMGGLGFRGEDGYSTPTQPGQEPALPPLDPQGTTMARFSNPIANDIALEAEAMGMDPRIPLLIAQQESGFNPQTASKTSSARGVFQFLDSDRQRYGGEGISQGLAKVQENYNVAQKALGRQPTPAEVWVVYYQGIGAGPRILKNPQASFRGTLNSIRSGWANTVIKANPWLRNIRTNADFIQWAEEKISSGADKLGLDV